MIRASIVDLDQAGSRRLIHPQASSTSGNALEMADT
jgi:hypothetical protein